MYICLDMKKKNWETMKKQSTDLRLIFMGFYRSGPQCLDFLLKILNCYPYKQSTSQSRKSICVAQLWSVYPISPYAPYHIQGILSNVKIPFPLLPFIANILLPCIPFSLTPTLRHSLLPQAAMAPRASAPSPRP